MHAQSPSTTDFNPDDALLHWMVCICTSYYIFIYQFVVKELYSNSLENVQYVQNLSSSQSNFREKKTGSRRPILIRRIFSSSKVVEPAEESSIHIEVLPEERQEASCSTHDTLRDELLLLLLNVI